MSQALGAPFGGGALGIGILGSSAAPNHVGSGAVGVA